MNDDQIANPQSFGVDLHFGTVVQLHPCGVLNSAQ